MDIHNISCSDDGGCLNAGFAKRILSKTSLKSSSSSGKSAAATREEEISKLHTEIDKLKQKVEELKMTVDDKDSAIGILAREKEKLYVELKKVQRTNRNIHQQLEDERDFYQKEKEHYGREISSIKRSLRIDGLPNYESSRVLELRKEVDSLNDSLEDKDKTIYNLCLKYLKIKSAKTTLKNKLEKLRSQHNQACEYIVTLLDSSREDLDKLITDKINSSVSPDSKKYLNLVKRNGRLHYENTQLKIRLIALTTADSLDFENCFDQFIKQTPTKKVKRSKSDSKVSEKEEETAAKVKRKSIYTLSHLDTDGLKYWPRMVVREQFEPMFEYQRIAARRTSSDPG